MKNIIKSQLFQLKRDRFTIILTIVFIAILLLVRITSFTVSGIKTGSVFFADILQPNSSFAVFFIMILVPHLCGADFLDKTNNYELMSGHSRFESFFGRVVVTIVYALIATAVMLLTPIIIETVTNGWGTKINIGDAVLRLVLLVFPYFRIVCEFIFLTFLIKNPYVVMVIGYLVFMLDLSILPEGYILGISNINLITIIEEWGTYGLGGSENYIYEASVDPEMIIFTILFSVVIGVASLFLGYTFFKKDDLS